MSVRQVAAAVAGSPFLSVVTRLTVTVGSPSFAETVKLFPRGKENGVRSGMRDPKKTISLRRSVLTWTSPSVSGATW